MYEEQEAAVHQLGAAIRTRTSAVIAASDASYVEDLVKKISDHLGMRAFVLYPGALEDVGPTVATDNPEATRDRSAWAAEGVEDPFAPDEPPNELAVYLGPAWSEVQQDNDVLLFADLPAPAAGEADALSHLISQRELRGRPLRDGVAVLPILDAQRWDKYSAVGFAQESGAQLIHWPGLGLAGRALLDAARNGDMFAHLDFDGLLGPRVASAE